MNNKHNPDIRKLVFAPSMKKSYLIFIVAFFFSAIISDMGFFHIGSTVELLAFLYVLYSGYQTYQELCDHPDEPPQDNSNR